MDILTPEQRHKCMSHNRGKNTSIELKLRHALWNAGFHYRKNYKKLPGTPDIVLTKYKIAIFCDSEFWHGKDWDILQEHLQNGNNSTYWINKIARNMQRDIEVNQKLLFLGWTVLRFWGKDINKNTEECVQAVKDTIEDQIYIEDIFD